MNQTAAYAYESQFGPPSELICINDFLRECKDLDPKTYLPHASHSDQSATSTSTSPSYTASLLDDWSLSPEEEAAIEAECRSVLRSHLTL